MALLSVAQRSSQHLARVPVTQQHVLSLWPSKCEDAPPSAAAALRSGPEYLCVSLLGLLTPFWND